MPRTSGQHRAVVVTGASTGIGRATTRALAARGYRVFAGVRREADAADVAGDAPDGAIVPVMLDVTDNDSVNAAAAFVTDALDDHVLYGLVNNAGIAVPGPLEFLPDEQLTHQLDVNVVGQVRVTQAFLEPIRKARGRIVFIGSIAGRSSLPFVGAYSASKYALEAIADALRVELAPWSIRVTILEPGAISTPIWERSRTRGSAAIQTMPPRAHELYGETMMHVGELMNGVATGAEDVETVTRWVIRALERRRPPARRVIGHQAHLRVAGNIVPTRVMDAIIRRVFRPRVTGKA